MRDDELLALAEKARASVVPYSERATSDQMRFSAEATAHFAFQEAATPEVVRGLIERAQKAEQRVAQMTAAGLADLAQRPQRLSQGARIALLDTEVGSERQRAEQAEAACGAARAALAEALDAMKLAADHLQSRHLSCGLCDEAQLGLCNAAPAARTALAAGAGERAAAVLRTAEAWRERQRETEKLAAESSNPKWALAGTTAALIAAVDAWRNGAPWREP